MAVYIDNVKIEWRGRFWCHMVADSIDELQNFAKILGLKSEWIQTEASYPHFDITIETRRFALTIGAIEGDRENIIRCARMLKMEYQSRINDLSPVQLSLI